MNQGYLCRSIAACFSLKNLIVMMQRDQRVFLEAFEPYISLTGSFLYTCLLCLFAN
jgi:hypothetical protein